MKSVVLIPYCPLPVHSGATAEMMRHLRLLRELGPCTILSARTRPVGTGWTAASVKFFEEAGFELKFREDYRRRLDGRQLFGMAYAAFFKALGVDSAFGHSNPYHRYAFPADWWRRETASADLAVLIYSYWSWLPCECPKAVLLYDLWSDYMRFGNRRELEELGAADLVLAVSKEEEATLRAKGLTEVMWCPPGIEPKPFEDSRTVGLVGSPSAFNVEGLKWLAAGAGGADFRIRVYGGLSRHAVGPLFEATGRYENQYRPYEESGIILMTTTGGMGVQIKGIEALASGRAIVARKGAMRGLPAEGEAWIEVENPAQMVRTARSLREDGPARRRLHQAAREYYERHLSVGAVNRRLAGRYGELTGRRGEVYCTDDVQ